MTHHVISNEDEMRILAASMASTAKSGDVYLLQGPLGAGKSAFARHFIQSLIGAKTEVPSPTFTLLQSYDSPKGAVHHFDLYRLENPDEVFELGWDDAVAEGICLVEWPERLGGYIPQQAKHVKIEVTGEQTRKVTIDG